MGMIQFLKELIVYLDHWEGTVKARAGFTDEEKKPMTLSSITNHGMRMTSMCKHHGSSCVICVFQYLRFWNLCHTFLR